MCCNGWLYIIGHLEFPRDPLGRGSILDQWELSLSDGSQSLFSMCLRHSCSHDIMPGWSSWSSLWWSFIIIMIIMFRISDQKAPKSKSLFHPMSQKHPTIATATLIAIMMTMMMMTCMMWIPLLLSSNNLFEPSSVGPITHVSPTLLPIHAAVH